jgi:hypothetical protein
MNSDWLHGDDSAARDAELGAALDAFDPVPALSEPEWDRLRAAVRSRAELPLARRRREQRPAAMRRPRWVGGFAAAAAAAAVVAVFALRGAPADPLASGAGTDGEGASMRAVVEEVLGVPVSRAEYELLFATGADTDALLVAAATP